MAGVCLGALGLRLKGAGFVDEWEQERELTVDGLLQAVSESVSEAMSGFNGQVDELSGQVDELSGRMDELSGQVAEIADVSQRRFDSLEQATLQAGELAPVGETELGTIIIELVGQVLGALDTDGDGSSDVATVVTEIRQDLADVSETLIHPAMVTPFTSYTVTEALLLLLVVGKFFELWAGILKAGFKWMR